MIEASERLDSVAAAPPSLNDKVFGCIFTFWRIVSPLCSLINGRKLWKFRKIVENLVQHSVSEGPADHWPLIPRDQEPEKTRTEGTERRSRDQIVLVVVAVRVLDSFLNWIAGRGLSHHPISGRSGGFIGGFGLRAKVRRGTQRK